MPTGALLEPLSLTDLDRPWHNRFEALTHDEMLETMTPEAIEALAERLQDRFVPKGEVLFLLGDEPDGMYRIVEGKVKVVRSVEADDDLPQNLLGVYGRGQLIGATSIADGGPRNATAVALTDCHIRFLPRADAEYLIETEPTFARVILNQLGRALRLAQNATSAMVLQDVPGRVARAVVLLSARFGRPQSDGTIHVKHDLTQADIASMVGASREAVNKAIADFEARGWLWSSPKRFTVLRYDRLARRAGQYTWESVTAPADSATSPPSAD